MKLAGTLLVLKAVVLWFLVCPGGGFSVVAEVMAAEKSPTSPNEAETIVVEEVVLPEEMGPTVAITPTGLISFDFREAAVRDMLRLFARQVKVNIVATPSVQGAVSMKLDNVNWRKAQDLSWFCDGQTN